MFESLHLPSLRATGRWQVAFACDPKPERRAYLSRAFPGAVIGSDAGAVWDDPASVDAVLIATPPALHAEVALRALGAGRACLIEKPLTTSVRDGRRVVAAWRTSGAAAVVGFNRRYRRPYQDLRRWRSGGRAPREIRFEFLADQGRWHRDTTEGDVVEMLLHDLACHGIDLVRWSACAEFRTVSCRTVGSDSHPRLEISGELEQGTEIHVVTGWVRGYREWLEIRAERGRRVAGPAGRIPLQGGRRLRGLWSTTATRLDSVLARARGRPGSAVRSLIDQLDDLDRRMSGAGGGLGADPEDGLRAVEVVEACLASFRAGGAPMEVVTEAVTRRMGS